MRLFFLTLCMCILVAAKNGSISLDSIGELKSQKQEQVTTSIAQKAAQDVKSVQAGQQAARQAKTQQAEMALEAAKVAEVALLVNAVNSQQVLDGTQHQLSDKEKVVEAAKSRVEELNKDLKACKLELATMRDTAMKAHQFATEAKQAANRSKRRSERDIRRRDRK